MMLARAELARREGETACDLVDRLPAAMRALVHDYGLSVVMAFAQQGVTEPRAVGHIMRAVTLGAREPGNRRPGIPHGGSNALRIVDDWLVRGGHDLTGRQLVRVIRDAGLTVLPRAPNAAMLAASVGLELGRKQVPPHEKHQRRLCAALEAGDRALWGAL